MAFFTDEQAAYLAKLYTGTDAPKLHKAPTMYVRDLERRYAERGDTIQWLERTIRYRDKRIDEMEERVDYLDGKLDERIGELAKALMLARRRGETIHRLERRLSRANRKHAALHRAMHEDTERVRGSLSRAVERFAAAVDNAADDAVRYGAVWPRFSDGAPVKVGDAVANAFGAMEVGSVQFYSGYVMLYDTSHWHYVKLYDGQTAERP